MWTQVLHLAPCRAETSYSRKTALVFLPWCFGVIPTLAEGRGVTAALRGSRISTFHLFAAQWLGLNAHRALFWCGNCTKQHVWIRYAPGKEDGVSTHLCETIYVMPGLNIEACPLKTGMISTLQLIKRHLTLNWKWISEDLLQCTFINLNDNTSSYLFLLCLHSYVNECAFGWYVEHDKILYTFLSDGLHFAQFSISCLK